MTQILETHEVDLATGQTMRIELSRFQSLECIYVSTQQGQIDIWLGDYSSSLPNVPHLHFYPTGRAEYAALPGQVRYLTVAGRGPVTPIRGCVAVIGR